MTAGLRALDVKLTQSKKWRNHIKDKLKMITTPEQRKDMAEKIETLSDLIESKHKLER